MLWVGMRKRAGDLKNRRNLNMTITKILKEFRQNSHSPRELGDKFERLMLNYLKTDPIYKEYFSQVWLWMDFPKRGNMPDTGIDLVAVIRDTGDLYCCN